ncbi:threonylcarbamoyl-AMP synthase [candidate division WWE3 bacterium RBG_19FT_COMBO_34_6]|uniref:L-threonylcarbamoyladenylate synthase n=1 Tax=candidate division WWE3 bacterium RBG_19FT_COMBO_34_6 TaxID=1802612 RepID=A0A1F4UNP2_UNCKA|nr:MAG: threonylcarbamoyl-AMP synthase [candidate division WWE3 bacterium RBG_19FT_COMBO_34_6]
MQSKNFCSTSNLERISTALKNGKIAVLPTDTIYGFHCLASDENAINKINNLKGRDQNTPYITLISDVSDLQNFGITLSDYELRVTKNLWPGRNTIIFTRDDLSKSFRLPDYKFLIDLLKMTGPLVSTSANKHGAPPSRSVDEIYKIFKNMVDLYVDGGMLANPASSIYKIENENVVKIR